MVRILISAFIVLCGFNLVSQTLVVAHIDTVIISELNYSDIKQYSFTPTTSNIQIIDSNYSIMQLGFADILKINHRNGEITGQLNMESLQSSVESLLSEFGGDSFEVVDRSKFNGLVKPKRFGVHFDYVHKSINSDQFEILVNIVVNRIDKKGGRERRLLPAILKLDEYLEILSLMPLKQDGNLKFHNNMKAGGFFYNEYFFLRQSTDNYSDRQVYIQYEQNENGYYRLKDKMNHWPTIFWDRKGGILRDELYIMNDTFVIPLQKQVLLLAAWDDYGRMKNFELTENQYMDLLTPISLNKGYVGSVRETKLLPSDDRPIYDRHSLILFDNKLNQLSTLMTFSARNLNVLSLVSSGQELFALVFDRKKKKFLIYTIVFN